MMAHTGSMSDGEKHAPDADSLAEQSESVKRALGLVLLALCATACYALSHLLRLLWPFRYAIAAVVLVGEVAFFALWCRRYSQLNTQPDVHAPAHVDSMRLFDRFVSLCYSLPDGVDLETYLCAWFRCARLMRQLCAGPPGAAAVVVTRTRALRARQVAEAPPCAAAPPRAAAAPGAGPSRSRPRPARAARQPPAC